MATHSLRFATETQAAVPESTFHVGDQPEDTEASRAAKVTADRIGLEPRRQDGAGRMLRRLSRMEPFGLAVQADFRHSRRTSVSKLR